MTSVNNLNQIYRHGIMKLSHSYSMLKMILPIYIETVSANIIEIGHAPCLIIYNLT